MNKIIFNIIGLVVFFMVDMQNSFAQQKKMEIPVQLKNVKSIKLYPNPANDFIVLKFIMPISQKTEIMIRNIIGEPIDVKMEIINDFEIKINLKDLPRGYYFLGIKNTKTNLKTIHKFFKE